MHRHLVVMDRMTGAADAREAVGASRTEAHRGLGMSRREHGARERSAEAEGP